MTIIDREMLWRQFGAAIDMLGDPMRDCPDELWEQRLWGGRPDDVAPAFSTFWYLAYHALFWLDLYLTGSEEGFTPPDPFDLVEMEPGAPPPRTYTRAELLTYLDYCRDKCQRTIAGLTDDDAARECVFPGRRIAYGELQLYNMRHVMEHGAQLRLFLGQQAAQDGKWVSKAR